MYIIGKITCVNLQGSNLKLRHTRGGIVWRVIRYTKLNFAGGIFRLLHRQSKHTAAHALPRKKICQRQPSANHTRETKKTN